MRFNRPSELKVRSRIPCRTAWCAANSAGHFGSSQSVLVIKLPRSFIFIFGIFQSNFLFIVFSYCRQVRACGVSTDIRNLAALQAMFSYGFLDVFNVISVIHTENSQISIWLSIPRFRLIFVDSVKVSGCVHFSGTVRKRLLNLSQDLLSSGCTQRTYWRRTCGRKASDAPQFQTHHSCLFLAVVSGAPHLAAVEQKPSR